MWHWCMCHSSVKPLYANLCYWVCANAYVPLFNEPRSLQLGSLVMWNQVCATLQRTSLTPSCVTTCQLVCSTLQWQKKSFKIYPQLEGDRTHVIYTQTTCLNVYSHKRCVRTLQWHCWMTQRVKREVWERSLATYTLRTWHAAAATIRCVTTLLIALMSTVIVKWVLLQLFSCFAFWWSQQKSISCYILDHGTLDGALGPLQCGQVSH